MQIIGTALVDGDITGFENVTITDTAGDNTDGYDAPADKSPFKIYVDAS